MSRTIAVITGSLRNDSQTRRLAKAMIATAPEGFEFKFVEIGALPLYNEDLDTDIPPEAWTTFRAEMQDVDGVMFVTPEYNRSVPAPLKNAIDVGSRPYGASIWSGKPAGIVSSSPSGLSGFGANHHLRQSLVFLDMPAMQQPEAYIAGLWQLFNDDDSFASEDTAKFLTDWMAAFTKWVDDHA